jgi:hypothetical protein
MQLSPSVITIVEPCCNTTINRICCRLNKDREEFQAMLVEIDIPHIQKQHIQSRYINILENLKKRVRKYSIVFFMGHFIITVGSLFVPALLSIQNSSTTVSIGSGYSVPIYTITFIVSLLVTIFNGILTLFKVDKKFYFLTTTMEKLRSEGWQYMGLTGRYSGSLNNTAPTHANQFLYFAHQIEKIKMKQVQEEFYKADDSGTKNDPRSNEKQGDLYPPSLGKPIAELSSIISPQEVKDAVSSIVKSQNVEFLQSIPMVQELPAMAGNIMEKIEKKVNEVPPLVANPIASPSTVSANVEENTVIHPDSSETNHLYI